MGPSLVGPAAVILVAIDVEDGALSERLEQELEQIASVDVMEIDEHSPDILITTRQSALGQSPTILISDDPLEKAAFRSNGNIRAVLPTSVEPAQLHATIEAVAEGLAVVTSEIFRALLEIDAEVGHDTGDEDVLEPTFTGRESQVLTLLADGASNKHIARALGISVHTAKFHVSTVMSKLSAKSRADVVAIGLRRGWIAL